MRRADDGAALDADPLHVNQFQAVPLQKRGHGFDGMITQMFVENGAQQHAVQHIEQIGDFKNEGRRPGQHFPDGLGHAGEIIGVGKNIERANDGGGAVFLFDWRARFKIQKFGNRRNAVLGGFAGDLAGGVNAQDAQAPFLEAAQERAVVAAHVHHQAVGDQLVLGDGRLGGFLEMLNERPRVATFVGVMVKQEYRINHVEQLDVAALQAQVQIQRIDRRFLVQFLARDIFFRHGSWGEGNHQFQLAAAAEAACFSAGDGDFHGFRPDVPWILRREFLKSWTSKAAADVFEHDGDFVADQDFRLPAGQAGGFADVEGKSKIAAGSGFRLHLGIGDSAKLEQGNQVERAAARVEFFVANPFFTNQFHEAAEVVNVERVAELQAALSEPDGLALGNGAEKIDDPAAGQMVPIGVTSGQTDDIGQGMRFGDELGHDLGFAVGILRIVGTFLIDQEFAAKTAGGFDDVLAPIDRAKDFAGGHLNPSDAAAFENLGEVTRAAHVDFVARGARQKVFAVTIQGHGKVDDHLDSFARQVRGVEGEEVFLFVPAEHLVAAFEISKQAAAQIAFMPD